MVKFKNPGGERSGNLEDRRSMGGGKGLAAGGGVVGIIVIVLMSLLGGGGGGGTDAPAIEDIFEQINPGGGQTQGTVDPGDDALVDEMSLALDDIQTFWARDDTYGPLYTDAKLVLFSGAVSTEGCGNAPASVGPFYCPADQKAYIDLSFFQQLDREYGAPGDFARVYVLAHELGHHVQNVTGTSEQTRRSQETDPDAANELSVRLELQADCYAGVWGHDAENRGLIEPGDIEEGLGAAAAVGDDTLGNENQESWTHGSADARQRWFEVGFDSGDPIACDTFSVPASEL